eukprot:7859785-Ditylum_brightwellii.AAC.2
MQLTIVSVDDRFESLASKQPMKRRSNSSKLDNPSCLAGGYRGRKLNHIVQKKCSSSSSIVSRRVSGSRSANTDFSSIADAADSHETKRAQDRSAETTTVSELGKSASPFGRLDAQLKRQKQSARLELIKWHLFGDRSFVF